MPADQTKPDKITIIFATFTTRLVVTAHNSPSEQKTTQFVELSGNFIPPLNRYVRNIAYFFQPRIQLEDIRNRREITMFLRP